MWLSGDVEEFVFNLDTQTGFGVGEIAGDYDETLVLAIDDYWSLTIITAGISYHFRTRGNEMAEMLVCVIFWGVTEMARLALHLKKGVLCPTPR